MVSVPNWTSGGYEFDGDRRFSARAFVRRIMGLFRPKTAPPVAKSLVYALCEEYRQFDLWAAYHAFRLDPRARTWRRLRRRNVPWQSEQTVEGLLHRLHPLQGKGTPDATTVGLALVTVPLSSAGPSKKKR